MPDQSSRESLGTLADLCTPWCVHVVATLRIADHIAAGKDQIDDLAIAAGCDSYALHRVLTHLVGKGVFEETDPRPFRPERGRSGFARPVACGSGSTSQASAVAWPMRGVPCSATSGRARPRTMSALACRSGTT